MAAWTDYGKSQLFAVGIGAIDMPILYVALYSDTADPSASPTELTLVGYGRQTVAFALSSTDNAASQADVVFGPLAAGSYVGLAVLDDPTTGSAWFWDDQGAPVTIPAGDLTFAAGSLSAVRTA